MRFWWPGRRTPILLMSLWVGKERGRVRVRAVQCGPAGKVSRGREGELETEKKARQAGEHPNMAHQLTPAEPFL